MPLALNNEGKIVANKPQGRVSMTHKNVINVKVTQKKSRIMRQDGFSYICSTFNGGQALTKIQSECL